MQERTVVIRNKAGIHCRPSSAILLAAAKFPDCRFLVESEKGSTDLKSILDLLALGLQKGDTVRIQASGNDEEEACARIAMMFETEFDFV